MATQQSVFVFVSDVKVGNRTITKGTIGVESADSMIDAFTGILLRVPGIEEKVDVPTVFLQPVKEPVLKLGRSRFVDAWLSEKMDKYRDQEDQPNRHRFVLLEIFQEHRICSISGTCRLAQEKLGEEFSLHLFADAWENMSNSIRDERLSGLSLVA